MCSLLNQEYRVSASAPCRGMDREIGIIDGQRVCVPEVYSSRIDECCTSGQCYIDALCPPEVTCLERFYRFCMSKKFGIAFNYMKGIASRDGANISLLASTLLRLPPDVFKGYMEFIAAEDDQFIPQNIATLKPIMENYCKTNGHDLNLCGCLRNDLAGIGGVECSVPCRLSIFQPKRCSIPMCIINASSALTQGMTDVTEVCGPNDQCLFNGNIADIANLRSKVNVSACGTNNVCVSNGRIVSCDGSADNNTRRTSDFITSKAFGAIAGGAFFILAAGLLS